MPDSANTLTQKINRFLYLKLLYLIHPVTTLPRECIMTCVIQTKQNGQHKLGEKWQNIHLPALQLGKLVTSTRCEGITLLFSIKYYSLVSCDIH